MKKSHLIFLLSGLHIFGYSQPPAKRIDSIVNTIETKKTLTLKIVSDTFPTTNPEVVTIESVKFYAAKNKLNKVIFSCHYYSKDPAKSEVLTQYDVFYFSNDSLIKVISKDFDFPPPTNIQFYIGEKELKKYLAQKTRNFRKHDGANYFIDFGFALLDEFKQLIINKKLSP